jgi:hypothetical protein
MRLIFDYGLRREPICAMITAGAKMKAGILVDASSPGQELRYVTAHFRDLQGLRMAPFWAALLVLTQFARFHSFPRGHLGWAAGILTAMQFGWLHVSGRWYERTYGVVKEPEPAVPSGLISILHPEPRRPAASNGSYGYRSGQFAILFLIWALTLLPDIFLGGHGHRSAAQLAILLAAFQVAPRCFYPVITDWSVRLRRIFAAIAVIAIIGFYLGYLLAQIDLWNWMATLLGLLLTLDLYDHWLLNHLLGGDFAEGSHE